MSALVYYFGCHREAGHYMFRPGMISDWDFLHSNPWGTSIDDGLAARGAGFSLHHKGGWTAIAKVDYSVDTRPGSNCAFLARGDFTLEQMLRLAEENFPEVAKRVGIRLTPSDLNHGTERKR